MNRYRVINRLLMLLALMMFITILTPIKSYASDDNAKAQEEIINLKDGTFLNTETDVEALESPEIGATVIKVFPAGSTLFVVNNEGDYYEITYQGQTMYVAKNMDSVNEDKMDVITLKQEALEGKAEMEKETIEEISYQEVSSKSRIWIGVIVGLVVVIIILGIVSTIIRRRRH